MELEERHKSVQKKRKKLTKGTAGDAGSPGAGLNNQFNNIILAVLRGACTR